nr:MAG TPA: hypothetical protein [Caudoviricetes sp.]
MICASLAMTASIAGEVSRQMIESVVGVIIQNRDINVRAVQGVKLHFQFVVAGEEFLPERHDDVFQNIHQLVDVDQLLLLFCELQRFQLAVDALRKRTFLVQVVTAVHRREPRGRFAQPTDVGESNLIQRLFSPVDSQGLHPARDLRLIQAKVFCNLNLSQSHLCPPRENFQ